jgi:hypothetical protein
MPGFFFFLGAGGGGVVRLSSECAAGVAGRIAGLAPFCGRSRAVDGLWVGSVSGGVRMAVNGNDTGSPIGRGAPSSGRVVVGNCDP